MYCHSQVYDYPACEGACSCGLVVTRLRLLLLQSAARLGVDVLSIDGLECKLA